MMDIDAEVVIEKYAREITALTHRAIIAEALAAQLERQLKDLTDGKEIGGEADAG